MNGVSITTEDLQGLELTAMECHADIISIAIVLFADGSSHLRANGDTVRGFPNLGELKRFLQQQNERVSEMAKRSTNNQ